ncbi:helix-turn-helix transcriptional regulator [Paenibacillus lemnae]|uniref:Helix-turn-helix transcriptional regulator n=2 Tax=Paenibacillus lemnae TaxID=1330551 RepID=A0A848M016_PAELE|nr:helix-turn-helix transcriptional regulator [Paenibacillus lemnae]
MFPLPKLKSLRANLFWRHFANYFVLILIPVIVASMLAHVLVVRLIEEDARKLSDVIMSQFTKQADTELNTLKTNMINMLSMSSIRSLQKEQARDSSLDNTERSEMIHGLRKQLIKLQADELVSKAYLIFPQHDLVIDAETYTSKSYYFNLQHPLSQQDQNQLFSRLAGKKMMDFLPAQGQDLPALMSYPFNSDTPDAYLVVNLNGSRLQQLIDVKQEWAAGTAILGREGQVLRQAGGESAWDVIPRELLSAISGQNSLFNVAGDKAVSLVPSTFDDSWSYLSVIDLNTLMKPAHITRLVSWMFLLFFLVVGSIVSYYLSRRIYKPIMEIKEGLACQSNQITQAGSRNDFDVIKRYSKLILTENQQLSQRVNGMTPIVHEHFLTKVLQGQFRDPLSIETYAQEIGFSYNRKPARTVLCVAFHVEPMFTVLSESSKSFLMTELKERMCALVPLELWLCQSKPDMLAVIMHHDPFLQMSPEECADILKLALQLYSQYFKATIGVGSTVHHLEELHQSYEQGFSVLQRRRLHSGVEICSAASHPEAPYDSFLSLQDINRMLNQVQSREYDKVLHTALQTLDQGAAANATALQIKQHCTDMLNTWIRAVEHERKDFDVLYYAGLFEEMNRCMTMEELKTTLGSIHALLFPLQEPADEKPQKFADIVAYIHEHYDQELSIEHFAGTLNMSVGHFSRTFKEEVGEKYVEYLARYRLMKAKELLRETDLRIDDIAGKVGYWGRNSFIRMFRKYEGITPAKYRMLHQ